MTLPAAILALALTLPGGFEPHAPSLPVFGGGKVVNLFDTDAAMTNASAHVAWSIAIPLAGRFAGGRKGMWVAGLSWVGWTLLNEAFLHPMPDPSQRYLYGAEVRTDLLTRIVPCASILLFDYLRSGGLPELRPAVPAVAPVPRIILPGIDGADPPRADPFRAPQVVRAPERAAPPQPSLVELALR